MVLLVLVFLLLFFLLLCVLSAIHGQLLSIIWKDQTIQFIRLYYPQGLWHQYLLYQGFISSISAVMRSKQSLIKT